MPSEQFVNFAQTTLNGGIDNVVTSLVVASASGFPGSAQFRIQIDSELMLVTALAGTTWTVTRGIESTAAAAHANGATVNYVLTGGALGGTSDAAAGTPSLRTLGTGSTQACAGNDSRLADARTPTAHASSHEPNGSDAINWTGKIHLSGTNAARPAAGVTNAGALYFETDTGKLFRSSGSAWTQIALGTSETVAHHATHESGGSDAIKLDDLAAPDDNSDLNATTSAHGLLRKLDNSATSFLNGQGNWTSVGVQVGDVVVLRDEKTSGTNGGTFTSGAWRTRDLNTEAVDTGGVCSLSSNQFTLSAGTYEIRATAPGYYCDMHQAKLRNVTDSADVILGTSEYVQGVHR